MTRPFYRLADTPRPIILVACRKCEWMAAFKRDDLIAAHGADCPMPNLLAELASPSCTKAGQHWDR
jgi:hypothetical protein